MRTSGRFLILSLALAFSPPGFELIAQANSLLPIEEVRAAVSERITASEGGPALELGIATVRTFGGLCFRIQNSLARRGDTVWVHLFGIARPRSARVAALCPAMIGPATMVRPIRLPAGRYLLFIDYRNKTDSLTLTITDSSAILTGARTSFVHPDERLRWRFPRHSFAFFCENTEVGLLVCDDVERWLTRQPGITELRLSPQGLNPYWPDTTNHPGQRIVVFGYTNDSVLGTIGRCFADIQNQIREVVGVFLTIRTWTGDRITAWSGRSYDQPHIQVPQYVTTGIVCRGSP